LNAFYLKAKIPPASGRVDKARRAYYWAWGGTWITGIAAWITYGLYINSESSIRYGYYNYGYKNENFIAENERMYYVSMGTVIALGAAFGYEIFQMSRYLITASQGDTPVVKPGQNKQETGKGNLPKK
jgi:hypothetical protein